MTKQSPIRVSSPYDEDDVGTRAERALWSMLKRKQFASLAFQRNVPFGPYEVNFFCEKASLGIFVKDDGDSKGAIAGRDAWLVSQGLCILRIREVDIMKRPLRVRRMIQTRARRELNKPN